MSRPPVRPWSKLLPHWAFSTLAGEAQSPLCSPHTRSGVQEVTEGMGEPQNRPLPACLCPTPPEGEVKCHILGTLLCTRGEGGG